MEALSKHWHVLVYIVGIIFLGGMTLSENNAQGEKIDANAVEIEEGKKQDKVAGDRLIRIEEKQKNQGDDIDEIKGDVKEILKELRERS